MNGPFWEIFLGRAASAIKIVRSTVVEIPLRNQNNFEVDARGDRKPVKNLQVRIRRVSSKYLAGQNQFFPGIFHQF